jgi:hypothetical protein
MPVDIATLNDCPFEQDENIGSYPIEELIQDGISPADIAYYLEISGQVEPYANLFPAWYCDNITRQVEYQRRREVRA